ncbi:hypothetical protein HaLaN_27229, partial [Haematococcus lacustris]
MYACTPMTQVDWEPDRSVAQTVRATPCFYNSPWFDN